MFALLKALWAYRGFVISSIRNDFQLRFRRSRLGGFWMIINPLAQALIYALILSNVLSAKLPGIDNKYAYSLYLLAGTMAWTLFSEIISRCLNLFVEHGNLMKKMNFPRITLPAIAVGSSLLNNLLLFVCILGVFAYLGHLPSIQILWLIPLTLTVVLLATGLGLVLGVMNVFVRDLGQVVPILLQILFWFTPVVYPIGVLTEKLQSAVRMNPMFHIVSGYQDAMLYAKVPEFRQILMVVLASMLLMSLGLFMFRRAAAEMVDEL